MVHHGKYLLVLTLVVEGMADHKVGVFVVFLTYVGTIIGGGVVGLPYAMTKTGFILGFVVNILNIMVGQYSCFLLLQAKNYSGLA